MGAEVISLEIEIPKNQDPWLRFAMVFKFEFYLFEIMIK